MGQDKGTGRRVALKTVVLAVTMVLAAAAVYLAANRFRWAMLSILPDGIAEWATLLSSGGMGIWAFFLIKSGIAQHTLELVLKAKALWRSLRLPDWAPFMGSLGDFMRAAAYPSVVTAFALFFIYNEVYEWAGASEGNETQKQAVAPNGQSEDSELVAQMDALRKQLDSGLERIREKLDGADMRSDDHFGQFPIRFKKGSLNETGTALVAGAQEESVRNPELIEEIAKTFLPCGDDSGNNPVILKVEGYASSKHFDGRPDSNEWNLALANGRRKTAARMLRSHIGSGNEQRVVVCESEDYKSLGEMERDREFDDRSGSSNSYLFTQSAHIKVLHPGMCKVSEEPTDAQGSRLTKAARECLDKAGLRPDRG